MEQEVMQAIRAELESNIDAKYREFHSSLVPGQNCRILGVRIPVSRRIAKATAFFCQPLYLATDGSCDYVLMWILIGIPFGIQKMFI